MTDKQYVISETGEFPPKYNVLKLGDNGIYLPVFGPEANIEEAKRKCNEANNSLPVAKPKKAPSKEKAPEKKPVAKKAEPKKAAPKKPKPKKVTAKKVAKKK